MRAALAGHPPAVAVPPGTRVLDMPLPPPMSVAPLTTVQHRGRWGAALAIGAVFAALLLALILIVFDSPQQSPPQPVTTSTPVAPNTTSTTIPSPAASTEETAKQQPSGPKPGKPDKPGKPGKPGNGNGDD
jgi:serine/threonine-protein kinase